MSADILSRVALRQVTLHDSRDIVDGRRPDAGWAIDFPSEGDVAVTDYWRKRPSEIVASWSSPWLIVLDGDVVGMVGFKGAPKDGSIEVGYGVVPSVQRQGVATAALTRLLERLEDPTLIVQADTAAWNVASQRVLQHLGFVEVGRRSSLEDGELIEWRRDADANTLSDG
jgi:RimJ/RimL family protein N-acetyltransferase